MVSPIILRSRSNWDDWWFQTTVDYGGKYWELVDPDKAGNQEESITSLLGPEPRLDTYLPALPPKTQEAAAKTRRELKSGASRRTTMTG